MNRPVVVILGPHRAAVSGVSTHVNLLMGSSLAEDFELVHFQVGSEGRDEGALGRLLRLAASPFALFATILFRHACVVHINTSLNLRAWWRDLAYLMVAKLLRARVVYQVHGGELPADFFASSSSLTALLRKVLEWPDVVVLLARREFAAYREFVPRQHLAVIPNGIDTRPFSRVPTVLSRRGYPLRLVYIGRLAREKGLYETLQAVRLASEMGVDARVILAGGGPEEGRLKRYAHALGVAARVSFAGPVFGEDKVKLLAGADLAVLPSYAEGLPYALLEAMAAGIPVLATPVGAIPDVMTDGIHGRLVPPRDGRAIAEALVLIDADRERLSWMSRACRRRVFAAFGIERLAAELSLLYDQLAGGFAAAPAAGAPSEPPQRAAQARRGTPASTAGGED